MLEIDFIKADLTNEVHQAAVLAMLNCYASDAMGDGKPLSEYASSHLIEGLVRHPTTVIFLATRDTMPCGIAICFRGFSTFAAKPLINIHDFYVAAEVRGQGVGRALLDAVENEARATGCCKLTLEVQENNSRARSIYDRFGFAQAVYAADAGGALFMSKPLRP
ncbi:GNAT family N-acetyltransferase [Bythopirellula goksoeyrii]|uniref:Putative acetyltransferase n=1 Tax=Bythopirellula goksoeyrii TaxID=1400387 RepID=A0A5B9QJU3_9BACT|nr:GNAT family N-acetyltransferase [Bythopirellula goksoeyrii]QEG37805.1 putative acetyltransferase [Bythopirellula goksoeyrii]